MNRTQFNQLIANADFRGFFIEIGWNNTNGNIVITIDDTNFEFNYLVERNGFQVLTCNVAAIPNNTLCRKIDSKLRRFANDYICIFIAEEMHHQWVVPIRTSEKRDITTVEYTNLQQTDFLFSKLADFSFALDETTTIVEVKQRVQGAFFVNSERITKDFYTGFKKEHKTFSEFISGIDDHIEVKNNKNKQWYTSVMLNRLMFCYFIQKKGFLNFDTNYLQNKLQECQKKRGENKFFSTFYKGFLCQLFQGGLNSPQHDEDFEVAYGRIPYLNGGMFDQHQLEKQYADLDIDDRAFESLFSFFDKWNWHLDTRITASGKDINPDVLGYIFEQYINDRAAMGAYYTKEDITGYIGKNCIIPFLMDKVSEKSSAAFKPNGYVWNMMKSSGDTYIYPAVKRGYSSDWRNRIPDYIEQGIDTKKENLLERRVRWNEKTDESFALPTEIWRETIERMQRCESLLGKINSGEIVKINDFITYNLDITSFAEDVIRKTDDHLLVRHFYEALQNVTILDPTCGSGAFLFAALNILEPLYEACLDKMEDFHQQNNRLFKDELEEINNRYRSNRQYFIYKSIILRNLYGVDIMVEATEIAKLRLFLKMVAVVDVDRRADNLGLDPLPDIDFNIKCGNTLVGYASEKELNDDLSYGDMFANAEFKEKIEKQMQVVAKAYELFRSEQLKVYDDNASIKTTKEKLNKRLAELNDLLNHRLHQSATTGDYDAWLASHQPFHWLAEFYQIIHGNGGFDVIIGNPPYVEMSGIDYKIQFCSSPYGNLYAYCTERCAQITRKDSHIGLIVPMSITSIREYKPLRRFLQNKYSRLFFTNHSIRPTSLFNGISQRVSILLACTDDITGIYATKYLRSKGHSILFQIIQYSHGHFDEERDLILPKVNGDLMQQVWTKIHAKRKDLISVVDKHSNSTDTLFYKDYGETYWIFPFSFCPWLTPVKSYSKMYIQSAYLNTFFCITNSSLFYIYHTSISDCWHLGNWHFIQFPISIEEVEGFDNESLSSSYQANRIMRYDKRAKGNIYEYKVNKSKPIIDEIDKVLAKHYGFTEEELDFIINYDIKYRMGDELNNEEE